MLSSFGVPKLHEIMIPEALFARHLRRLNAVQPCVDMQTIVSHAQRQQLLMLPRRHQQLALHSVQHKRDFKETVLQRLA
jgi:hypothetical protein